MLDTSVVVRGALSRLAESLPSSGLSNPLPVDARWRAATGSWRRRLLSGRKPRARVMDLLIAATADTPDARLYTANADDLRGMEDLVEIVPV
ncbi:MAG: hypothetical protein H0V48_10975 [Nocardioidaceae bacterium]|nr:hypothetical protein [Nocardioidaceae bacterium]